MLELLSVGEVAGIAALTAPLLVFLFVLSFVGGAVTSSMGPGGILLIVALYLLTPLTGAQIAGTSAGIFFIGSTIATVSYARSGDIEYKFALVLALASVVGVRGGVWLNAYVSEDVFGLILASLVSVVGVNILYREYHGLEPIYHLDIDSRAGLGIVAALGLVIGCIGGLTGIGGAALSVPALILLGISLVDAVAAGMVQGVFITASTATSYALAGETVWSLMLVFTAPFAVGIVVGWLVAHRLDARVLKIALGSLLVFLGGGIVVL